MNEKQKDGKPILTEYQHKLANGLLDFLETNKCTKITYGKLAERINDKFPLNVGKQIGKVSELCHHFALPLISVKVISANRPEEIPSEGFYYGLYKKIYPKTLFLEEEAIELETKKVDNCPSWEQLKEELRLQFKILIDHKENKTIKKQKKLSTKT